jgi:putative MATE family efflux protein
MANKIRRGMMDPVPPSENSNKNSAILSGPIGRGILSVAAPSVITMLVHTANGFLDSFFVGGLGPHALAAVGVGMNLSFLLMSAAMAVNVGTTAIVARSVGEGDLDQARDATRRSVTLIFLIGVAVALPMALFRDYILRLEGLDAETLPLASSYLLVNLLGIPFQFVMLTLGSAYRGLGDTIRPFFVTVGACLVHAALNYVLIFGKLGFPKLGLTGGALALGISQLVATVLFFALLPKTRLGALWSGDWRLDLGWSKRLCAIGLPAAGQQILRVGSMTLFQTLIGRFGAGSAAIAALSIGLRSESLAFMPGFGYAIAASAFVGQNLGAEQPERARRGAWIATAQAMLVMSVMGLVFFVLAEPIARMFVREGRPAEVEKTIALAVSYLRIAAISEPFLALGMVLTGALQGAGETRSPTIVTAVTMVGVRLPIAWLLLHFYGVHGAWWAMTIATILQGLVIVWLFKRGSWQETRV